MVTRTAQCDEILQELLEGNSRYRRGETRAYGLPVDRDVLVAAQRPIAAVLSCSDSRVVCEHMFDQGPGRLFVVRVAGNFLNADGLASIEFAVESLGVRLVFVLGHSSCGAISAAIEVLRGGTQLPGNLPRLASALQEPVVRCEGLEGNLLANAVRENVRMTVERVAAVDTVIGTRIRSGAVRVLGGIFDLPTGAVSLLP
jgi:carbonic anhydrase